MNYSFLTMGRDSNKHFFTNDIQMVNMHMKRIIMSLMDSTHIKVSKRNWKDTKLLREVISRKTGDEM